MKKTILLTGATDGIGLETAKILAAQGHILLLHGRNEEKLQAVVKTLSELAAPESVIETYVADLANINDVIAMSAAIKNNHKALDVLINNAGVFRTNTPLTTQGYDVRFVVNTVAPYVLMQELLPLLNAVQGSRVVNLSSAAQAPVNLGVLSGSDKTPLADMDAYAQSKLAITMWSRHMAAVFTQQGSELKDRVTGPVVIAVNPGSLLATKMVKEGFGVAGSDISIGANILIKASFDAEFSTKSGAYFDNDSGRFAEPHAEALSAKSCELVVEAIEQFIRLQ